MHILEKTDIELPSGDWDHKPISKHYNEAKWTEEAYNLFLNDGFVKRVKQVFDKLPFDVVIMPTNEGKRFTYSGFHVYEGYRTKLPLIPSIARFFIDAFNPNDFLNPKLLNLKDLKKETVKFIRSKMSKNKLVVIMASNHQVEDRVLMTPWTLAHGISHAVERSTSVNSKFIDSTIFNRLVQLCEMVSNAYDLDWHDQLEDSFYDDYEAVRSDTSLLPPEYLTPFFTFKSARENNMIHSGEFFNECFAQFLVTGKVTLNKRLPETIHGKPLVNPDAVKLELINRMEKMMNQEFTNIILRLKGKILVTYDD